MLMKNYKITLYVGLYELQMHKKRQATILLVWVTLNYCSFL